MATLEKHHFITYDEWEKKYKPIEDEQGNRKSYDTHKNDLEDADYRYVWTFRDSEDGRGVITNGFGRINRLEYYKCSVPWNDGEYIEVRW